MLMDSPVWAQIPVADMQRARRFYTDTLGLKPSMEMPGMLVLESAEGTGVGLYETPSAGKAAHTLASWKVDDLGRTMSELRGRGITFEEYDMPDIGLTTKNGVVQTPDGGSAAWFKDSEGNILCVAQTSK